MKKSLPIIFGATVVLLLHMNCLDFPGMTETPDWHSIYVHIRNMSTSSGVILTLPSWMWQGGYLLGGFSVSIDPSPEPGIPVDSTRMVMGPHTFEWSLRRALDSVVVDSGSVYIAREAWVLIEEDDGEWSCTWTISPW